MVPAKGIDAALNVGAGAVLAGRVGEGDDAGDGLAGGGVSFLVPAFGGVFSRDIGGVAVRRDVWLAEAGGEVK